MEGFEKMGGEGVVGGWERENVGRKRERQQIRDQVLGGVKR